MEGIDLNSAVPVAENNGVVSKRPDFDLNSAMQITEPVDGEEAYLAFKRANLHQQLKESIGRPLSAGEAQFIQSNPGAFESFAVPYVEGVVGFFTRPFGYRPTLKEPFGLEKGPTTEEEVKEKAGMQKEHPVAFTLGQIIGGTAPFIATAPLFPQSLLGTLATFETVGLTGELGRQRTEESLLMPTGERAKIYGREAIKSGVLAPVWYFSGDLRFIGRPFLSAAARAGARGTAVFGLESVFGEDLGEALKQGGIITALSLMFESPYLAKTALGRGILNRANNIMGQKYPGFKLEEVLPKQRAYDVTKKEMVDLPAVDTWDQHTARANIFDLVKGLYNLMRVKIAKTGAEAQKGYDRLTYPPEMPPSEATAKQGGAVWVNPTPTQPQAGGMAYRPQKAPIFYSKMASALAEKMPESASPDQIRGIIQNSGIPKEEMEWSGIEDFLKDKQKISKIELLDYLQKNRINIEEVTYSENIPIEGAKEAIPKVGATKYSEHQLPGGENYREVLFKLPTPEGLPMPDEPGSAMKYKEAKVYTSPHWKESNVLAHARLNDRTTPDGKKILFIEEVQSDWAREARRKEVKEPTDDEIKTIQDELGLSRQDAIAWSLSQQSGTNFPNNVFLKHWQSIILKRLLRYAADNGYDGIAWTTGEQQAERYDLSKKYSAIDWKKEDDLYEIIAYDKAGNEINRGTLAKEDLSQNIGKDLAEKITQSKNTAGSFTGLDLKIGGEWAQNLYDKQIPNILKDLTKISPTELDMSVEVPLTKTRLTSDEIAAYKKSGKLIQPAIILTPELKQKLIQEGQPLFGKAPSETGAPGKEFTGIRIFRMDEDVKIVNTRGEIVTLPKGEEYRTLPVYDSDGNIVPNKVKLQDGKQITVYEGELRKLKGKILGEGEQPKAGGMAAQPPESAGPEEELTEESSSMQLLLYKIKELQKKKDLSGITIGRIKEFLGIKGLKKLQKEIEGKYTILPQLQKLLGYLENFEPGDKLISEKQLEGLKDILKDFPEPEITPKRIIVDKFGEEENILKGMIIGKFPLELMPTVDIKEGHPIVTKIVDDINERIDKADQEIRRRDNQLEDMLRKAQASRSKKLGLKEKIKRSLIKQDKEIFRALSGEADIELTKEESAVVAYLKNFFKMVRTKLKLEKYRQNYVTHLEQPFMEKIVNVGLVRAIKQYFREQAAKKGIATDIMLELDNIIGSEKFFRFALQRKGGIKPTTNIQKIVHDYSALFETKLALDEMLPAGQAVTKLLLQGKDAVWLKKFLQNLKGRGLDYDFRNGRMGWLTRLADAIVDIGYMKLLALNWRSAVKNIIAGETNAIIWQDFSTYLKGKQRLLSSPKKAYQLAVEYGILEGTYADYTQRGIGKLKKLQDLAMIGQKAGEIEIRTSMFISELSDEEWKTGKLSPSKIALRKNDIAITQGIFSKTESPLWVQTVPGRTIMQMNRWRITDAMLLRRIVNGAKEEWGHGNYKGKNTKRLIKAIFFYILGMYTSYELAKAGFKKAAQVAQSMAEVVNSLISLISQGDLKKMITDNPTLSVLKEFFFSAQNFAKYIHVPGAQKAREIEFQEGIEDTYIAPLETIKDILDEIE